MILKDLDILREFPDTARVSNMSPINPRKGGPYTYFISIDYKVQLNKFEDDNSISYVFEDFNNCKSFLISLKECRTEDSTLYDEFYSFIPLKYIK